MFIALSANVLVFPFGGISFRFFSFKEYFPKKRELKFSAVFLYEEDGYFGIKGEEFNGNRGANIRILINKKLEIFITGGFCLYFPLTKKKSLFGSLEIFAGLKNDDFFVGVKVGAGYRYKDYEVEGFGGGDFNITYYNLINKGIKSQQIEFRYDVSTIAKNEFEKIIESQIKKDIKDLNILMIYDVFRKFNILVEEHVNKYVVKIVADANGMIEYKDGKFCCQINGKEYQKMEIFPIYACLADMYSKFLLQDNQKNFPTNWKSQLYNLFLFSKMRSLGVCLHTDKYDQNIGIFETITASKFSDNEKIKEQLEKIFKIHDPVYKMLANVDDLKKGLQDGLTITENDILNVFGKNQVHSASSAKNEVGGISSNNNNNNNNNNNRPEATNVHYLD